MANDDTYNGWSNRETWAANLWIENEEGSYHEARRLTRQAIRNALDEDGDTEDVCDQDAATDDLASMLDSAFCPEIPGGLAGDLLGSAVRRIDWHEIARHMIEEECR